MNHDPISASTSAPERELAGARAAALDRRDSPLNRQERADGRLRMAAPAREGCCGLTFTSHAKRIICPLCGRLARAS